MDRLFYALVDKHGLKAALQIVEESFAKAHHETQKLFGDREYVSRDELTIVWNDEYSSEQEKLSPPAIHKAGEQNDGQTVSPADAIRARSLGVIL
jgi:hypothetical protein